MCLDPECSWEKVQSCLCSFSLVFFVRMCMFVCACTPMHVCVYLCMCLEKVHACLCSFSLSLFAFAGVCLYVHAHSCGGDSSVVRVPNLWLKSGSNPCWNGGRIFFSRVNFLCWLLFRYLFHPCVTAVARKRSRSSCQKCRWQVTAKHAYSLRMWLCMKWHGAWLYGVHRTRRDGSRFMWHQPCQRCTWVHHFGGY